MKTSTIKDIEANIEILQGIAIELANNGMASGDEDSWQSHTINGMYFDFNTYVWVNEKEQDVVYVTVYPVIMGDDKYGSTDTLNYKRLAEKNVHTGKMKTLLLGAW
jgi:hypothetical protein